MPESPPAGRCRPLGVGCVARKRRIAPSADAPYLRVGSHNRSSRWSSAPSCETKCGRTTRARARRSTCSRNLGCAPFVGSSRAPHGRPVGRRGAARCCSRAGLQQQRRRRRHQPRQRPEPGPDRARLPRSPTSSARVPAARRHERRTRANCSTSSPAATCTCATAPRRRPPSATSPPSITKGQGDVRDVEPSYDGTRLVFALHEPLVEGADPEDQPTWDIWEYDVATGELQPRDPLGHRRQAGQRRRAALPARRAHRLQLDPPAPVAGDPARRGQAAVRRRRTRIATSRRSCCTS